MLTLIMESFVQSTSSHFIKDFIIITFFFFNHITINLLYTAFLNWTSYVAQYKYNTFPDTLEVRISVVLLFIKESKQTMISGCSITIFPS